ncbi:HAD-IA family hydrolase [Bacteroidota bacterium]
MDFAKIELISFDCYGTLIDWQKAVQDILELYFNQFSVEFSREDIFGAFLRADAKLEAGKFLPYREILAEIVLLIADDLRISVDPATRYVLSENFSEWKPFADTVDSLKLLKENYKLAIISNVDDDLFALTNELLEIKFDFVVTAGQLGSYKPDANNFLEAHKRFDLGEEVMLHAAQSIYHDIAPSNKLGWNNAWVNRYGEPERTDPAEFPDFEVPDLASLVKILRLESDSK